MINFHAETIDVYGLCYFYLWAFWSSLFFFFVEDIWREYEKRSEMYDGEKNEFDQVDLDFSYIIVLL